MNELGMPTIFLLASFTLFFLHIFENDDIFIFKKYIKFNLIKWLKEIIIVVIALLAFFSAIDTEQQLKDFQSNIKTNGSIANSAMKTSVKINEILKDNNITK